jgi:GNAT superfamily N-acetyltransferase
MEILRIRLAEIKDIEQLIQMRWDFTFEDEAFGKKDCEYSQFQNECQPFLLNAINSSSNWFIWVAEVEGKIVSHIYVELIQKVPRPGRITYPFAYMTNVYTVKGYRGNGIGSKLISTVNEWAKEQNYEFIIVWPSDGSIDFYRRNGYQHCKEPMEFIIE